MQGRLVGCCSRSVSWRPARLLVFVRRQQWVSRTRPCFYSSASLQSCTATPPLPVTWDIQLQTSQVNIICRPHKSHAWLKGLYPLSWDPQFGWIKLLKKQSLMDQKILFVQSQEKENSETDVFLKCPHCNTFSSCVCDCILQKESKP